jgi:glycosyltransferase involved in cell wall biosynthesis
MLHGANIVCLAAIDWAFNWQIPQEVAAGLAAAGNRVLFVENTGIRRPRLKDLGRLRARLHNWRATPGGLRAAAANEGVDVLSPMILPLPYARWAQTVNEPLLRRAIERWLAAPGQPAEPDARSQWRTPRARRAAAAVKTPPTIVITFLPTPLARATIRALAPALSVFYCADRLSESSPAAARLAEHEQAMFAEADLVLTTSSGLLESARPHAARAVLFQGGVRADAFQHARSGRDARNAGEIGDARGIRANGEHPAAMPESLRALKRPIVGYVGSLRNEMDRALLAEAARLAPELTFVLAGPVLADVSGLTRCPNVIFLGPLSHAQTVNHMAWFDAGIIPYALNAYTADIMPVKLLEYLAAGLPVVSTGLPEVRRFAAAHGPVVSIADGAEAFTAALRAALAADTPTQAAHRAEIAQRHDWTARIAMMSGLMEEGLAARRDGSTGGSSSSTDGPLAVVS